MQTVLIVIPCYNEESRLPSHDILTLATTAGVHILLINDGSLDGTAAILESLCLSAPDRNIQSITLPKNRGKGEAVRCGILAGLKKNIDIVGYIDADMAVPVQEVVRLVTFARQTNAKAILASRIAMLGHDIKRKPLRHYLGRIFATAASFILKAPVYDTQCGAKFFKNNQMLDNAVRQPFLSRWAFDVELIGRLLTQKNNGPALSLKDFVEVPLLRWEDQSGSKLGFKQMAIAALDLFKIWKVLKNER